MDASDWKFRLRLFVERYWQPTTACMTCMPGSLGNLLSLGHWTIALQTGLFTGLLALLLSFTPARRVFRNRYGNALIVGCLTTMGDAYSHVGTDRWDIPESVVTGLMAAVLALIASWLFEDRARRLRSTWGRLTGAWRGRRGPGRVS